MPCELCKTPAVCMAAYECKYVATARQAVEKILGVEHCKTGDVLFKDALKIGYDALREDGLSGDDAYTFALLVADTMFSSKENGNV